MMFINQFSVDITLDRWALPLYVRWVNYFTPGMYFLGIQVLCFGLSFELVKKEAV